MLESFYQEIKILTYCRHPNIVRIIDASFNGTMIKEEIQSEIANRNSLPNDEKDFTIRDRSDSQQIFHNVIKRKTKVCYCVLKLVQYGELFQFLESTEKFSSLLARTLFL
jgi:serine/threonine protein kinase